MRSRAVRFGSGIPRTTSEKLGASFLFRPIFSFLTTGVFFPRKEVNSLLFSSFGSNPSLSNTSHTSRGRIPSVSIPRSLASAYGRRVNSGERGLSVRPVRAYGLPRFFTFIAPSRSFAVSFRSSGVWREGFLIVGFGFFLMAILL
jgi:hypothetical protein